MVVPRSRQTEETGGTSQPGNFSTGQPEKDEFLYAWFPRLDTERYIIPVVHYETVRGYNYKVAGYNVKALQTDRERNIQHCIKNEKARVAKSVADVLKRVHDSMTLIKNSVPSSERFVIMTEVKCALYNSLYAGAAARNNKTLSNPESSQESNLQSRQASKVEWDMKDGLTDLLVIHPDRGLLLGAVTRNTGSDPNALRKDLRKAVAYLHRAEFVVKNVILAGESEKPAMTINKTILLPNLTTQNLNTLCNTPEVKQQLEFCLGVQPGHDVTRLCLTKDDMADEQRLKKWWTACLKHDTPGDKARMGNNVYIALVARSCCESSLDVKPVNPVLRTLSLFSMLFLMWNLSASSAFSSSTDPDLTLIGNSTSSTSSNDLVHELTLIGFSTSSSFSSSADPGQDLTLIGFSALTSFSSSNDIILDMRLILAGLPGK